MKKLIYLFILTVGIISCSADNDNLEIEFEFISEYSTTVMVGGIVGIKERTFKIGEIYKGTDEGGKNVTLRIAEHTELNDDCPNSTCYQELLGVPREFLKSAD